MVTISRCVLLLIVLVGIGSTAAEQPARSGYDDRFRQSAKEKENAQNGQRKQENVGIEEDNRRNLRHMINDQKGLRRLHRGDRNGGEPFVSGNGRRQAYYAAGVQGSHSGRGKGGGKGKGGGGYYSKSGGGSGDGDHRHNPDDDFFPTRGRRSRYRLQPLDEGNLATPGLSIVAVQPAYYGTGIGRIDRPRGRSRSARQSDGNRFPPGFRADTIRPKTQAPTSLPSLNGPTISPSTIAPGATSTPTLGASPSPPGTTNVTVAPGTTAGPTAANAPNDIVIRSTFGLTYFTDQPTDVDRDLTPEEYAELASHLDTFYSMAFQTDPAFSNDFLSYMTDITTMNYVMGGTPQVTMDFDANYSFASGSDITVNAVLTKMESLDYMSFIETLLRGNPINQLDAVMMVDFAARVAPA
jgi:hypothetical protein